MLDPTMALYGDDVVRRQLIQLSRRPHLLLDAGQSDAPEQAPPPATPIYHLVGHCARTPFRGTGPQCS